MKRTFHNAPIGSSRIQRVFAALRRRPMTTFELGQACQSTRPASDVSEANKALDDAGLEPRITCEYLGTQNERRIYRYHLSTASA